MGELGQLLRETREEKGITLERVEASTRIRQKYLVAIEDGNYDDLPTPGHVHGFLRNYALYLGLDLDEVESLYNRDQSAQRRFEPKIFHPKDITLVPRKSWFKADLVLGLVIVLVLAAGGWAAWQYGWPLVRSQMGNTPAPTATTQQVSVRPSSTATKVQTRSASPTPTSVLPTETPTAPLPTPTATLDTPLTIATPTLPPTETPTPAPTRAQEGVVLKVKVIERAWMQVSLDGQELSGELLQEDEEREWEAQYTIYLICGNAGGVEVTVNGEELGTLGERGEVVEKIWAPEGEITPTPVGETSPAETPTATTAP